MFWDDGDSLDVYDKKVGLYNDLEFTCNKEEGLKSRVKQFGFQDETPMELEYVAIFGVERDSVQVRMNGENVGHYYDEKLKVIFEIHLFTVVR